MRIAVVGAGWAAGIHAAAHAGMEGVEIAAIVGRSRARARTLAAKVNAPSTDLAAVLADETIEAVDVCVPSGLHRAIAVPALQAGKHVFLETPIALSLRDADAVLAAAKQSGRIVAVEQTMKFVVPWTTVREAVRKGDLGRPRFVHAARLSPPYWSAKNPRDFAVTFPIHGLRHHRHDVLGQPAQRLRNLGVRKLPAVPGAASSPDLVDTGFGRHERPRVAH